MKRLDTTLEGPVLVEGVVHGDERGFFQETYRRDEFAELGIAVDFVQDNHSRSRRGIVRGMHFQPGDGKDGPLCTGGDRGRPRRYQARLAQLRPVGGVPPR